MKSSLIICCTTLLIAFAVPVNAKSASGTITFRGAITNGSCNMNVLHNPVVFDCYDPATGKAVIKTADITNSKSVTGLPVDIKMHWLNPEKNKGVIEVNYL